MMRLYRFLLPLLLVATACSSLRVREPVVPAVVNLSNIYNPSGVRLHPAYTVYHDNPGMSLLIVKIFPVELLYSGGIEPDQLIGQVRITYYLNDLTDPDSPVHADSGAYTYNIRREDAQRRFITQIPMRTGAGKFYQLTVITRDQVRREENITYLYVDRRSEFSEQNYMIIDVNENIPFFQPYVVGNAPFMIRSAVDRNDTVHVSYYGQEIPLPRPSFSLAREDEYFRNPDSLWALSFNSDKIYRMNYKGIYHFQFDTAIETGLTLFNFGPSYPHIQYAEELIDPLAYLTTSVEYAEMKGAQNLKLALDDFWLDKAGNAERARELIRVYYNRVYYSNYYFTAAKPGWKTDRGMIYIIYGPPQRVTTTANQEKWIYYKNNFTTSVTFTFDIIPTAYSLNNYVLQRSENYDAYWREAVDTWRRGNIYLIN
ncbi:MAG: GWxTD domain-containing protein [Bacteroidales bacterium]|nr:GWxTD domain-containing protein [Bacteroidales bacterium]